MILAIDTAGPWVSVALGDPGGDQVFDDRLPAALNHNEELARLVDRVLARAEISRPRVIAVDVGPGSFTGTRVGVAYAVGLAQGWDLPVYCASVFQIAASAAPVEAGRLAVALPVVRDAWCRCMLERTAAGWEENELCEITRDELSTGIGDTPLVVPWGEIPGAIRPAADWTPARALWALAASTDGRGAVPAHRVAVRYVGPSQAEKNFHARRGRS